MKYILIPLLFLFPSFLFGQAIDSSAIRQVDSLIEASRKLIDKRAFAKASEVNAVAENIALEKLGKESAAYGSCCQNRCRILSRKGNNREARKWCREAMAILEKELGREHPKYAQSLHGMGVIYIATGQREKAEPLYLEALAIREKTLGSEHPKYVETLLSLGLLYTITERLEKAESILLEAKTIQEKALDKKHQLYAYNLSLLGNLYYKLGQHEKAEPLYLETKSILEKTLGRNHPRYAGSLINLASLYNTLGQYEKAKLLYLESLAIQEKVLGKNHPRYASNLDNLAYEYKRSGEYEKAESAYLEALAIRENVLGKKHPHYANSLNKLAYLYWIMDQYEKAEPLYLEALTIREKTLGKKHSLYARNLYNLAKLYQTIGQYNKAESAYLEALAIRENVLGKKHPDYADILNSLARLYWIMGQNEKSESLYLELSKANKQAIENASLYLSERELGKYLSMFSYERSKTLSFAQIVGSEKIIPVCYDNSLFYKGFLLHTVGRIRQLALSDKSTSEKLYQLKDCQRQLSAQYARPIAKRDSATITQLNTKANDMEKELARSLAGQGLSTKQVQWQDVQSGLKEGESAIEFVHYQYYDNKGTDSLMYAALVLHSGKSEPTLIPLFDERSLDSLLSPFGERRADYVNHLYSIEDRGLKPTGKEQRSLYELIWQPLEKELSGTKTIYFSPSGLLHRLNLGAIPLNDEEILSDQYRLIAMNSSRQLVVPTQVNVDRQEAVLFGGIQYEMDNTTIAETNKELSKDPIAARGEVSFSFTDSTSRGGSWNYLKWTDREVDKIAATLATAGIKTEVRKSYAATEKSFKTIGQGTPSPRILHLATHGFFFPDPVLENREKIEGSEDEPVFKMSDHPMIRSGLILSGGNYAWQTGQPAQPEMEDGILTAYEISQVNLSNTELVVLSACETGLGDIKGNEGVYGLQRAFKIAGAKYLIMSLWQVPDQETAIFMQTFYKHWIEGKLSIPDAFRTTQREMKERFLNPYQWAGFVLIE